MAELSDKDIEFIKDLREKREENSISRRGALALLGGTAVGAGGVLGGNEVMGKASADASTSDTDPNVGTPDRPADIWAQGIDIHDSPNSQIGSLDETGLDIPSVSTKEQATTYYASNYADLNTAFSNLTETDWERIAIDPIDSAPYTPPDADLPFTIPSKTVVKVREDMKLPDGATENLLQNEHDNLDYPDSGNDEHIAIVFAGGSIDGNRANVSYDDDAFTQNPIMLHGVSDYLIQGATIHDSAVNGIIVGASEDGDIVNNTIDTTGYVGVMVTRNKDGNLSHDGVSIINNTVKNAAQDSPSTALVIQAAENAEIAENTVKQPASSGIGVSTEDAGLLCRNITVDNNTVVGGRTDGSDTYAIQVSARGGEVAKNIVVSNNTYRDGGGRGIIAHTTNSGTLRDVTIQGNAGQGGLGSMMIGTGTGDITGIDIIGNTMSNAGSNGIYILNSPEKVRVKDNTLHTHGGRGILDAGGVDHTIEDNDCYDNGKSFTTAGIEMQGVSDSTVAGNHCYDDGAGTQTYGIITDTGCDGLVIINNDLRNNATAGHDLNGTGRITDPVNQDTTEDYNVT